MNPEEKKEKRTPIIPFMKWWSKLNHPTFFTVRIYYNRKLFIPYQVKIKREMKGIALLLSNTKISLKRILNNTKFVRYDAETSPEDFYDNLESMYGFSNEYGQAKYEAWNGVNTAMSILGFLWLSQKGEHQNSKGATLFDYVIQEMEVTCQ